MFQIIFNEVSAAEMAEIPKLLQLDILSEFDRLPDDLENPSDEKFGKLERDGKKLYRYRAKEYRIYFEPTERGILIHRVLHANSLKDFLYRTRLPLTDEDEVLQADKKFWELISEAESKKKDA
ncbi:type II toxin-antitoxin system RelE/ParE family toxin [Oscillatoria laete-virens NRMC-F 0139]|nr:type II toxin-antitoxin system RelE/ParE family toxin [Oscillatoria laete-virens]MDL5054819.1 type II toxin-antitoxin system RelE/ParE family toxin [Oscillatoria laete-virens NRMC-F 0139]